MYYARDDGWERYSNDVRQMVGRGEEVMWVHIESGEPVQVMITPENLEAILTQVRVVWESRLDRERETLRWVEKDRQWRDQQQAKFKTCSLPSHDFFEVPGGQHLQCSGCGGMTQVCWHRHSDEDLELPTPEDHVLEATKVWVDSMEHHRNSTGTKE